MNKVKVILCFTAYVFFHVDHLAAQRDSIAMKYANEINVEDIKKHLFIIAADDYEGRETGKPGQKKAAQYLADYYASIGIGPSNNGSYFQQYPLKKEDLKKSYAESRGNSFKFIDDFYTFNSFELEEDLDLSELVFVGYGIDDKSYSDYKNMDVVNKVLVVLSGEPIKKDGKSYLTGTAELSEWSEDLGKKIDAAQKRGAKAILIVSQDFEQFVPRVRYWLESATLRLDYPKKQDNEKVLPFFFLSPSMAEKLMFATPKKSIKSFSDKINKKGKSIHFSSHPGGKIHMERTSERITAENVLGFIEGSDPQLKSEIVIVSAHYDHIGIVKGEINNGADDDGSGTVSTLELAQAFMKAKNEGHGPRRSVLFLNVSGEEKGLLGSEWYSEFPIFPLENTVCDLNIDMIGRKDANHEDPKYVYLIGSNKLSTDLHSISENANSTYTQLSLDYTYNDPADPNRFYYRSDHYNFAKNGIPVIFYFSGVHEDYHQPGDDPEKILFDKMCTIARLVFYTAWDVANRDQRIVVDVAPGELPKE